MSNRGVDRYEQYRKERENNYLRLVIIIGLIGLILVGKGSVFSEETPIQSRLVTPSRDNLSKFKDDLFYYSLNVNKKNVREIHNEIKNMAYEIERYEEKLHNYKNEERQLNIMMNQNPMEEYKHNKLDLIAFMVESLKEMNLVYEIDYNYQPHSEEQEEEEVATESMTDDEESPEEIETYTQYYDTFMVKVYQIDTQDNYNKVIQFLDNIFIREPYSIIEVNISYDEVSESYYLELILGI